MITSIAFTQGPPTRMNMKARTGGKKAGKPRSVYTAKFDSQSISSAGLRLSRGLRYMHLSPLPPPATGQGYRGMG